MPQTWKQLHRASSCTSNVIESLIPKDERQAVIEAIRQECVDEYGSDIISQCTKRKVCLSKSCLGRELPWKSKTALPYLKELTKTKKIENGLLFVETDCTQCPLVNTCDSMCDQVSDYLKRDKNTRPKTSSKEPFDSVYKITNNSNDSTFTANIPWDSLSNKRRSVIKLHLYDRRDFKYIAKELNLNNQSRAKYEYYAALTTISEYAIIREFLKENLGDLTEKQQIIMKRIYYDNANFVTVADEAKVSKQAIQQMVGRVINKYDIKWQKFVWKKGSKIVYNVPKVLK